MSTYIHTCKNRLSHVTGLTVAGSSRWSDSPVTALEFLRGLKIVYCRIKKLSTDNSSETLTQALSNLESVQSRVMNINRYDRTYRNGILVAKFRVSYVKITSTQRNTGRPVFDPRDRL